MSVDQTQHHYIAGAGLAGCVLAAYLARRGWSVEVFEKRADMRRTQEVRGRSINLALAERGMVALREIGVLDDVMAIALPMRGRMLHERSGKQHLQRYSARAEEVIYSVNRGHLNRILIDAAEQAGAQFHFNCPVQGLDLDDGMIRLADEHTRSLAEGVLFGCDGAGSIVRQALEKQTQTRTSTDWLPHGYQEFHIDPDASGNHRMASDALHIWPRKEFMLIALPNPDGSFTVTLFLAHKGGEASFDVLSDSDEAERFFRREFPDFMDLAGDQFRSQHASHPVNSLGTVRCRPWSYERITLVGDAAHAIVPFHAQGMNCAFEDCTEIDRLIGQNPSSWTKLLADYDDRRRPNANAIADMALENYIEMRDLVADPVFQLQNRLEAILYTRHPDRFVPRYAMVMFRTLPYDEARQRGQVQAKILDALTASVTSIDQLDLDAADDMVREQLQPMPALNPSESISS